jgi:hypothetical protein
MRQHAKVAAVLTSGVADEVRWIEIDLSDLWLSADLTTPDHLAGAATHVYERFVAYADDGWEWLTYPGSRQFDGWLRTDRGGVEILAGARLLSRRAAMAQPLPADRPAHGLSPYRTRQLTATPWTAEPGSKLWKPFS